jgi:thioredoxin 1
MSKMNKLALLLVSLLVFSCAGAQHSPSQIQNIDAAAFKKLVDAGNGIVLDVRTQEEWNEGTIPNATTIDFYGDDFKDKINLMNKEKEIYVYCLAGSRSAKAASILIENGFTKVYNLTGGFRSWKENGFPVTTPSTTKDENIKTFSLKDFNSLLATGQPLLVDFHTKWCAPCRQMAPVVDQLSKEYQGKVTILRIDIEQCKELADTYSIKSVPLFIYFKGGKEQWRHTGIVSETDLKSVLDN